jgi:hypothetical protein
METQRSSLKKLNTATTCNVSVGLLAVVSTGLFAAVEPSWRQIHLDPPNEAVGRVWSVESLPTSTGLIAEFGDQTQCLVEKLAVVKGVVTMAEAGLDGPFLALWWDTDGTLTATVRAADMLPVESFTLRDEKQTDLVFVRRDHTIYAYAVEAGVEDPLIALDFKSGSTVVAGALIDYDTSEQVPAMSAVAPDPALTGDVLQTQPGMKFAGDWITEDNPESLGGSHLLNRGDAVDASVAVRIENLLPGAHELWIRHAAAASRTEQAEITVEGFGKSVPIIVNQRISGGLWLPLGRFETKSATYAAIRLAPGKPGSGSISMDAVHAVWSVWADKNHDQRPDALEGADTRNSLAKDDASTRKGIGSSGQEDFSNSESSSLTTVDRLPVSDGSKSVIYVHSALGNDSFDGRIGKPHPGAWFSVRGGPKRSIAAGLKSVPKSTRVIELHLDGKLEPPVGGFQNLGNVSIVLVPGKNGTSLENSDLPPVLPPPSQPQIPTQP